MKQTTAFRLQSISFLLQTVCLGLTGALLLVFPKQVSAGVTQGLQLCFSSLVGSLLPFLVVSKFFLLRGMHLPLLRSGAPFTRYVLRLPAVCGAVFLFSMIGGYPVGASMTAQLAKDGSITQEDAKRLLLFCVGPGPSFAIAAVGSGMLGSRKAGVVLYLSVVAGAVLTGILTRFLFRTKAVGARCDPPHTQPLQPAQSIDRAVRDSVQTMVLICGFVALFSALLQLLQELRLPQGIFLTVASLLEVTNACQLLAPAAALPVLAAAVAWGGICTHCQLSPFIGAVRLSLGRFWIFRAVHAACSYLCCRLLLKVVKLPRGVLQPLGVVRPAVQQNYLLSFCMCMMCVLLLLGSGWSIRFGRAK